MKQICEEIAFVCLCMFSSHPFVTPKKWPGTKVDDDEMEDQINKEDQQFNMDKLNNINIEDVDVRENVHWHLN